MDPAPQVMERCALLGAISEEPGRLTAEWIGSFRRETLGSGATRATGGGSFLLDATIGGSPLHCRGDFVLPHLPRTR